MRLDRKSFQRGSHANEEEWEVPEDRRLPASDSTGLSCLQFMCVIFKDRPTPEDEYKRERQGSKNTATGSSSKVLELQKDKGKHKGLFSQRRTRKVKQKAGKSVGSGAGRICVWILALSFTSW